MGGPNGEVVRVGMGFKTSRDFSINDITAGMLSAVIWPGRFHFPRNAIASV